MFLVWLVMIISANTNNSRLVWQDKKDRKKIKIVGQEYQNADYIYTNFMSEVDKNSNDKYKIPNNFSKINEFILDNIKVYEVYKKNN